jgi:beta-barrel assembly-enhancing protease
VDQLRAVPSTGYRVPSSSAQAGKPVPQTRGGSNAAWKQDAAAEGGNFSPDYEALKSAQELDEKVGKEQAVAEAKGDGVRDKGKEKPEKIEKKYDVRFIGERGVGGGMNFFSIDKEIQIGKELAKQIDQQSRFLTDPVVNEYVNRLAQNLMRNSDAKVPITVKIIDSDELNAFALPGGFFYINVGMLMATESEAELAGVMAHEIGHVAARHATKNATKQQIWNLASIPLMFVGGPAGMIVRNVAQFAVPMTFMKFSRGAEREADLLGLEYEYAAGYDPAAMVNFFEKLQSSDRKKPNFVVRAFQSHPMTDDRLKRAQKTIATMLPDKEEYLLTSSEYDEMKMRLASLITNRMGITPAEKMKPVLKSGKFSF